MKKDFDPRRLDIKAFAESGAEIGGQERLGDHSRLMAETGGRGADVPLAWSASAEVRNPAHVHPQIWLHLAAETVLSLTCQRCLAPVDVEVAVKRSFRFVRDEAIAMAQDDGSEEDLLALSRSFELIELVEDELLMDLPVAPRHEVCPTPVKLAVADEDFEAAVVPRENPFALLKRLKTRKAE